MAEYSVFSHMTVDQMWPQEETRSSGKQKFYYICGFLERGSPHATQGHRGSSRFESGGRTEEQGVSLGQSLHWNFCRKGRQDRINISGVAFLSPADFGLYGVVSR